MSTGQLFSKATQALFYNYKQLAIQWMLDFEYLCACLRMSLENIVKDIPAYSDGWAWAYGDLMNKLLELREELSLEEQIDGSQVYLRAVSGADKRQKIFGIGSLASQMSLLAIDSSSSNFKFQSTPDNICMQNQIACQNI